MPILWPTQPQDSESPQGGYVGNFAQPHANRKRACLDQLLLRALSPLPTLTSNFPQQQLKWPWSGQTNSDLWLDSLWSAVWGKKDFAERGDIAIPKDWEVALRFYSGWNVPPSPRWFSNSKQLVPCSFNKTVAFLNSSYLLECHPLCFVPPVTYSVLYNWAY